MRAACRQHGTLGLEEGGCPDPALVLPLPGAPRSPTPRLGAPLGSALALGPPRCHGPVCIIVKVPLSANGVSASVPPRPARVLAGGSPSVTVPGRAPAGGKTPIVTGRPQCLATGELSPGVWSIAQDAPAWCHYPVSSPLGDTVQALGLQPCSPLSSASPPAWQRPWSW